MIHRHLLRQIAKLLKMDYDEILTELGQFSQWHMVMILPLFVTMGTASFGILSFSFTGRKLNILNIALSYYIDIFANEC